MSFIVGLTGGIGSGKSTVAELFAGYGAALVDTDRIAHELTGPQGSAMPAIANAFGDQLLCADGALDRIAMRRRVFDDPDSKVRLEAILHPMIRAESVARCAAAGAAPYVILVVPLLVESRGYRERTDRILVVDCEEAVQIARVMARSGLAADEVRTIMATQATRVARRAIADDVVLNDGGMDSLLPQVERLHHKYLELAMLKVKASC